MRHSHVKEWQQGRFTSSLLCVCVCVLLLPRFTRGNICESCQTGEETNMIVSSCVGLFVKVPKYIASIHVFFTFILCDLLEMFSQKV